MYSLYTSEKILTDIWSNRELWEIWKRFVIKLKPTLKIVPEKNSDFENSNNSIFEFITNIDLSNEILDNKYLQNSIPFINKSLIEDINDPFAIFLLDIDVSMANSLSQQLGVTCISFSGKLDEVQIFSEGVDKIIKKSEPDRSWKELKGDIFIPSNSLIFVDRYLFADDTLNYNDGKLIRSYEDGITNVMEILDIFLPENYPADSQFDVMFIFDDSKIKEGQTFQSVLKTIHKNKSKLRDYQINIEGIGITKENIFNYDETHNRRVLSNFYLLRAEHSLKAFKDGKGLYSQTLWMDPIGSKGIIRNLKSDIPAKALIETRKELKKSIITLMRSVGKVNYFLNGRDSKTLTTTQTKLLKMNMKEIILKDIKYHLCGEMKKNNKKYPCIVYEENGFQGIASSMVNLPNPHEHKNEHSELGLEGILEGKGTSDSPFTFTVNISSWFKGDTNHYIKRKNCDENLLCKYFPEYKFEFFNEARFKYEIAQFRWFKGKEDEENVYKRIALDWVKWQGEIEKAVKMQAESQTDNGEEDK